MGTLDFYDKPDRPWPNPRLSNAAIVGETTEHSVKLWVRTYAPGEYWVVIATQPLTTEPTAQPKIVQKAAGPELLTHEDNKQQNTQLAGACKINSEFAHDLTNTVVFDSLQANCRYYYACFSESGHKSPWEFSGEKFGFRTQKTAPDRLSFGLYSCHMPYPSGGGVQNISQWERMTTVLDECDADFAIGAGDQVYTDGNKHVSIWRFLKKVKRHMLALDKQTRIEIMKSWYRDIYRGYWGHKQVKAFFARFPQYMIWDDHDIMDGWGSYTKDELARQLNVWWDWDDPKANLELANNMRNAAEQIYMEYQHAHNPSTAKGRFDYHFLQGNCAFYIADMRGHRNYDSPRPNRVLGDAQMKRIRTWLASKAVSKAAAVFIVLSVPIVHHRNFIVNHMDIGFFGIADDLRDQWEHRSNWTERDKLLAAVFQCSEDNQVPVVFLSGDVHVGAAFSLSNSKHPKAKVYQLTSSAITYANYHGDLLRLIIKESGELGHTANPRQGVTSFNNLCVFEENNFGVVRIKGLQSQSPSISFDLYGASRDDEVMIRRGPFILGEQ